MIIIWKEWLLSLRKVYKHFKFEFNRDLTTLWFRIPGKYSRVEQPGVLAEFLN